MPLRGVNMPGKGPDRRVQKTRQLLKNALVALIAEKGFDRVRVQDILDKANVGRSTFYFHFQNKRELLHSCFEETHKLFDQRAERMNRGKGASGISERMNEFLMALFQCVEHNKGLFRALMGGMGKTDYFSDFVFDYIYKPFKTHMAAITRPSGPPAEIITHYFLSAFMGTIKWWVIQDKPYTAEEIDRFFMQLTMPGLLQTIGLDKTVPGRP